jgi:hypothetical protein
MKLDGQFERMTTWDVTSFIGYVVFSFLFLRESYDDDMVTLPYLDKKIAVPISDAAIPVRTGGTAFDNFSGQNSLFICCGELT